MVAQIEQLNLAVKHKEDELVKVEELFTDTSNELSSCTERLHQIEEVGNSFKSTGATHLQCTSWTFKLLFCGYLQQILVEPLSYIMRPMLD